MPGLRGHDAGLDDVEAVEEAGEALAAPGRQRQRVGLVELVDLVGRRRVEVGAARYMARLGLTLGELEAQADALAGRGRTPVFVAVDGSLAGLIGVADPIREGSAEAIRVMQAQGAEVAMITGDTRATAGAVAREVGITRVLAEVLPEGKADAVAALRSDGQTVAMVGDGVNDAPALAAADVGIAMSTGTDIAMHAAGITLMRGDPRLVADAIDISKRTYAKIRQGLFWAFVYNLVSIPLAALGYLSPVIAGAAMALSSVSVVAASKRYRPITTPSGLATVTICPGCELLICVST